MNNKTKNLLLPIVSAAIILILSAAFFIKGETEYSESERRLLAKFPELSAETLLSQNDNFMDGFEAYSLDQFPFRDGMRSIKAMSEYFLFGNLECNGFYLANGHIAKKEYPQNDSMLDHAAKRINYLCDNYLEDKGGKIYFSLIPDKNAFLAEDAGVLSLDYEKFEKDMLSRLPNLTYIDIFPYVSEYDFYYTDQHWKQESIVDVANVLTISMGNEPLSDKYEAVTSDIPFYGTYHSQAALPMAADELTYLTNDTIENCIVNYIDDSGMTKNMDMYVLEKLSGRDPYEMFLGGSQGYVTIENPNAKSDKELIIFRDSFGSSITPLLCESYKKITLLDLRYVFSSDVAGNLVRSVKNADVLFMYSALILNNSSSMK